MFIMCFKIKYRQMIITVLFENKMWTNDNFLTKNNTKIFHWIFNPN